MIIPSEKACPLLDYGFPPLSNSSLIHGECRAIYRLCGGDEMPIHISLPTSKRLFFFFKTALQSTIMFSDNQRKSFISLYSFVSPHFAKNLNQIRAFDILVDFEISSNTIKFKPNILYKIYYAFPA